MTLEFDKTEWKRVTLGEVAVSSKEKVDPSAGSVSRYVAGEHMDSDDLTIHRWGDVGDIALGPAFHRRFRPGQILYGSRRTYLRKVAVADFDGVCANTTFVVQSRDEKVLLQDFLPFVMSSEPFHAFAIAESKGSVNPYVNWSDIERFEFDLPPLDEQRRIADLLWTAERHRRTIQIAHEAIRGVYMRARLALLTIGPRGDWLQAEIGIDGADTWINQVPKGWSAETLSSVGRVCSGATPNRSEQVRYFDGGEIPWVKTLDLNEGTLSITDEKITSAAIAETSTKIFPAGTVLVAMYGGFAQIGRTARLGIPAATNQAVSAILDLRDDVNPAFLHEALKAGRPKWRKVAASSRKDPNITKKDVENFDFPLPPLEEQAEILAILSRIQRTLESIESESRCLGRLQRSLLLEAFGGN
ncbi:restriction endonuclease subunit S [Nocardia asiatica]|uniref:restriction endonuclease subunit S n=1 Tax=Nocardia asiatica TaxID=209252 RepID=UPI003EE2B5C7